jgi:capsular polysaccharide biosynthesis protein
MIETQKDNNQSNIKNEIELIQLLNTLVKNKIIIILITAFASIAGVVYSLSLPNIYQSEAILAPASSSNSISGALRSYSGIAGLAGINLSSGDDGGNSQKAIQKLKSLSFFENNIMPHIFLPNLMAIESWNLETNKMVYDESIYIKNNNTWIRKTSFSRKSMPSAQESFAAFKSNHLTLNEDKNTGFITLSIKHQSPFIAKEWAELMIRKVNAFYREKDKLESENAVNYLSQKIKGTDLSEIKLAIADLLQEETKKLALIEANQYYVFDYIDPPAIMEQKSGPKRSLICIISALLGAISAIFLVLIHHYFIKEED